VFAVYNNKRDGYWIGPQPSLIKNLKNNSSMNIIQDYSSRIKGEDLSWKTL